MSGLCSVSLLSLSLVLLLTSSVVTARQEWEEQPGYREVNPEGDVVMVCRVRNKAGECRWERDNTPIAAYAGKYEWAGDTKAGDCSLRILNAKYEYDNGGWVCQVTASSFKERDTLISHPANLVVRAPPSSVHLKLPGDSSPFPGSLVATSGSEVEVECVARGGNPPPGLQWYVGGERWEGTTEAINQETGVTVSIVSFPVDQADHKKEIRCEVVHEALKDSLDVVADLDVQSLPVVSLQSGDISDISEGDQVSLTCVAAANPPAAVMWYREGSGEIVSRKETLEINHIRREQAGVYVCQANNSVGQSQPRQIELAVQYSPVITSVGPSHNLSALVRSKVELTCEASGNPVPQFTWVHHTQAGDSVKGHEKNLIITGVSYTDQGTYECRATNFIKGREMTVKSKLVRLNVTGPPRFEEKRSEVFIVKGTDAVVSVEFCADPVPNLRWEIGGPQHNIVLYSDTQHERFSVPKEVPSLREDCYISSLNIFGAAETDSKEYHVHLENEHGKEIHVVKVSVGEVLAHETLIGGIAGGAFVLILLLIGVVACVRRCCTCTTKQLKQDIESHSSSTGWSSQSDVSINTEPQSELSTGTGQTMIQHEKYFTDSFSITQECLKSSGFNSPTPSNLTDRPGSNASGPSRVSYNELLFPKTANYGSMRKNGRCDIESKLNGAAGQGGQANSIYHFH